MKTRFVGRREARIVATRVAAAVPPAAIASAAGDWFGRVPPPDTPLSILVLRFWHLAPNGPKQEPATACDPTDLTDPTDRSDRMRWLAIPRALPWAGRGLRLSGRAKQRNTKTYQAGETLPEARRNKTTCDRASNPVGCDRLFNTPVRGPRRSGWPIQAGFRSRSEATRPD